MKDGDCRMFLNQMFLLLLHLVLSRETASAMGSGHALPGMKAFGLANKAETGRVRLEDGKYSVSRIAVQYGRWQVSRVVCRLFSSALLVPAGLATKKLLK